MRRAGAGGIRRRPGGPQPVGRRRWGRCRVRRCAVEARCTTRRRNAHRTEEHEVLYRWHPWAGCVVQIHEVIEKAAGNSVRCSRDGDASGRWLELPLWMFDRSVCTLMRVETFPRVDLAALTALQALLSDAAGDEAIADAASSNAPVSDAGWISHDKKRGDIHATSARRSSRPSEQDPSIRCVRATGQRWYGVGTDVADTAGSNAPDAGEADGSPDPRTHAQGLPVTAG